MLPKSLIPFLLIRYGKVIDYIRISGYIEDMKNLAAIVKSLEDETRLRIMALLLDREELCVCDFMAVLQLPQSTVSRHLANLKNSGWLSDRRAGVWIHYSLARDLSPIHTTLVAALRNILLKNEAARKDRQRLAKLSRGNCCA